MCADKCGLKLPAGEREGEELDVTPAPMPKKTPRKQSTTKSECLLILGARVVDS